MDDFLQLILAIAKAAEMNVSLEEKHNQCTLDLISPIKKKHTHSLNKTALFLNTHPKKKPKYKTEAL